MANNEWLDARSDLIRVITSLGFPEELGNELAKNLGSPKAIDRMTAYLINEKPRSAEIIVDEMLAIKTDIDTWRQKKESIEANAKYNENRYLFGGKE